MGIPVIPEGNEENYLAELFAASGGALPLPFPDNSIPRNAVIGLVGQDEGTLDDDLVVSQANFALDSAKLGGIRADDYSLKTHDHDDRYSLLSHTHPIPALALDSDRLGGELPEFYSPATHTHTEFAPLVHSHTVTAEDVIAGEFSGAFSFDTVVTITGINEEVIDHDNLLNYDADRHFLQSEITEVGIITSGSISPSIITTGTFSGGHTFRTNTAINDEGESLTLERFKTTGAVTTGLKGRLDLALSNLPSSTLADVSRLVWGYNSFTDNVNHTTNFVIRTKVRAAGVDTWADNVTFIGDGSVVFGNPVTVNGLLTLGANLDMATNEILNYMAVVGSPTFTTIQHMQDVFHSSGWVSGGVLSDAGGGDIDVAAGTGLIRATDFRTTTLNYFDWSESLANTIPDGTARFFGVKYNAGSPVVTMETTDTWDYNTDFPIGSVVREGATLHISQIEHAVGDHANAMIQRMFDVNKFERDNQIGGLILAESADTNRYITVSTGFIWEKLTRTAFAAFDSDPGGRADTFDTYKHVSGTFTLTTGITQWPNTEYDDGTDLVTMTGNRYANLWFYGDSDGEIAMVYGVDQYVTTSLAELEEPPPDLPIRIQTHSFLLGRLIFQKSATTATQTDTVFETVFLPTQAATHSNLSGLTADDHTQYILEDGTRAFSGNISHGGNDITSVGNIGVGTGIPDRPIEIRVVSPVMRLRATGDTATQTAAFVEFGGTTAAAWSRTGYVGDPSSGTTDIALRAEQSDLHLGDSSSPNVINLQGGNVGIGETAPDSKLEVNGTFHATGAATFDSQLNVAGTGPHAIGGAALDFARLHLTGSFTSLGASTTASMIEIDGILTGAGGDTIFLTVMSVGPNGVVTQTATETIASVSSLRVAEPRITKNLTGDITNADTLLIVGAPTEGATNNALRVTSGSTSLQALTATTVTLSSYLQGTTGNGYLDLRGDFGAGSGVRIDDSGNVLIGTITAATGSPRLDVVGDDIVMASNVTDASTKAARFAGRHYTNAEQPMAVISGLSTVSANTVHIGGNETIHNTATVIEFYTAANTTTIAGTLAADITGVGASSLFHARGDIQSGGDATIGGDLSLDGDLNFVGPQAITTTTGDLSLTPAANLIMGPLLNFINESVNTKMDIGLTINQDTNSNECLALKSSTSVAHNMTDLLEEDTYATFTKVLAGAGGLIITGVSEATRSLVLRGYHTTDVTGKTNSDGASVEVRVFKSIFSSVGGSGADANLFAVLDQSITSKFIVDVEGDLFADGGVASTNMVTLFDKTHDAILCRGFDLVRGRTAEDQLVRTKWDDFVGNRESELVKLGVLGAPVAEGGLVNITQLQRLHNGAIWQAYIERQELHEEYEVLKTQLEKVERLLLAA